ncbi:hypothetical protein METP1_03317 [Methanosarcinales archaeon]|nr:hypothetical protein METP1_03317 [Methanosarcinales archaeon]
MMEQTEINDKSLKTSQKEISQFLADKKSKLD